MHDDEPLYALLYALRDALDKAEGDLEFKNTQLDNCSTLLRERFDTIARQQRAMEAAESERDVADSVIGGKYQFYKARYGVRSVLTAEYSELIDVIAKRRAAALTAKRGE